MDRVELGERMCQWHSSMSDPIYAVGSFYVSGQVYPDKGIVEDAISNLTRDLDESKRMLKGEKVMVVRQGKQVDLKKFAGFKSKILKERIADLEEIISELQCFLTEDYNSEEV